MSERFLRHEAALHGWRTLAAGIAFLAGGIVAATAGVAATITLTAVLCAGAGVVALGVREPPRRRATAPALLRGVLAELRKPEVAWVTVYYVLVFCLLRYCFHTYQPYLEAVQQEDALALGGIFFALSIVAAPWSRAAPGLVRRFGERRVLLWMPLSMAASLVAMAAVVGPLGIVLFFVHQAPFGAHWAVIQSYANHHLDSASRATALSVLSFAGRVAFAVLFPLLGAAHAEIGLRATLPGDRTSGDPCDLDRPRPPAAVRPQALFAISIHALTSRRFASRTCCW